MTTSLVEWLSTLPPARWTPYPPAEPVEVEELERRCRFRLPPDHRELLLASSGGALRGKWDRLHLQPAEILLGYNQEARFREWLPEMFVIGDDGGGSVYYCDPQNRLGRGAWALYLVHLGSIGLADSIPVGPDLTTVCQRIVEGSRFHDLPRLGGHA